MEGHDYTDKSKAQKAKHPGQCNKHFENNEKGLTAGCMVAWCHHGFMVGFHYFNYGEGRNESFQPF
jgi:hypothetical protein